MVGLSLLYQAKHGALDSSCFISATAWLWGTSHIHGVFLSKARNGKVSSVIRGENFPNWFIVPSNGYSSVILVVSGSHMT